MVDIDAGEFLHPGDMPARLARAARATGQPVPSSRAEVVRCILDSLAVAYRRAIRTAAELADRDVRTVHLVGGGARNALLCQLTADATGLPVVAGPVEAAALGNVLVQARAAGVLSGDLLALRTIAARGAQTVTYLPDRGCRTREAVLGGRGATRSRSDPRRRADEAAPVARLVVTGDERGGEATAMDVHLITERRRPRLRRPTSCPRCSRRSTGSSGSTSRSGTRRPAEVLSSVFGLHPLALHDMEVRNRLPKLHAYPESLFLVLHAPERGAAGHVHHVELDRVVGPRYLITVHGPVNPAVSREVMLRDTDEVLARIRSGRLRPRTSFDISHAIVSTLTRHMERFVEELTSDVWDLERG